MLRNEVKIKYVKTQKYLSPEFSSTNYLRNHWRPLQGRKLQVINAMRLDNFSAENYTVTCTLSEMISIHKKKIC